MAKYGQITQGSILNNVRMTQYPGFSFFGIIVTARCDIANCKVPKFHFLTAATVETWVKTEGLYLATQKQYEQDLNNILDGWKGIIPNYEAIQGSPLENIVNAIQEAKLPEGTDEETFNKKREKTIQKLGKIKKYYNIVSIDGKLSEELWNNIDIRNKALNMFQEVINEKLKHYCFLHYTSYNREEGPSMQPLDYSGLIINLLDINAIDFEIANKIENQQLDFDKLSDSERTKYNEIFVIEKEHDIIYPELEIKSPYLEWVMQQFSHAFIRIGINTPEKKDIINHYKDVLTGGVK